MNLSIPALFNKFKGQFIFVLLFLPYICNAQGIVNNGGTIVFNNSLTGTPSFANIYINGTGGNYVNQTTNGVNGTILNVDSGAVITVAGNWINNATLTSNITNPLATTNGVFINDGSMVVFAGTAGGTTQTISGASYGTSFYNLTFSGASPKAFNTVASSVKQFVNVSTGTTVNAGTTAGQGLTFLSSGTSSATLTRLPDNTAVITGIANIQRFITGTSAAYRGYRLLSSPVNLSSNTSGGGNIGFSYINTTLQGNAGAYTGGPGGTGNGFTINNPNPTIYLYDETKTTNNATFVSGKNIGIVAITPPTVSILSGTTTTTGVSVPVGNSYLMFFIGDNTRSTPLSSLPPNNTVITATGTPNQGTIPVTLWNTKSTALSYTTGTGATVPGFNQVGNPYASTISLDSVYYDNYNASTNPINPSFVEMQEPGQTYIIYSANHQTSSTLASPYIMSGQGFFVAATGTNQHITFKESQKVNNQLTTGSTPALLMSVRSKAFSLAPTPASPAAFFHLELVEDADSIISTQTGIYFSSAWSDAHNKQQDAVDLDGISPKVYLSSYSSDGVREGINCMGDYIKGKHIKLFVKAITTGTYHLEFADIKNINPAFAVYLVDNLLKDSVNLQTARSYHFTINAADTTTFGANRFYIDINPQAVLPYQLLTFTGQKLGSQINLKWTTLNEGNYTGFVLQKLSNNQFVTVDSLQSNGGGSYNALDSQPIKGVNTYRLKQVDLLGKVSYSALAMVEFDKDNVFSIYPNPAKTTININVNRPAGAYSLVIYNTMGGVVQQLALNGTNWIQDVSQLSTGTYIVRLTDSKGGFIGQVKLIKVQ